MRRNRLLAAFVLFKKNSSLLFWESRRRIVTVEKAATLSMEAGYLRSKRAYKAMLADDEVEGRDEAIGNNSSSSVEVKEKSCAQDQDIDVPLSDIVSSPSDESDSDFQANEESDETGSIVSLSPTLEDRTTPPPPSQSWTGHHHTSLLGSVDNIPCDQWTVWLILEHDVTPSLMQYRENLLNREPNGSVERLATTHIYLFDQDDQSSTLFYAIDNIELWTALSHGTTTTPSSSRQSPASVDNVAADIVEISGTMPQLSHADAPDYILDSKMNPQLKRLLLRLVETSHLWTGSADGEFGGFEKTLSPFIKIYLSGIKGTATITLHDHKQMPRSKFIEVKQAAQTGDGRGDLEKLAFLLRDSLDDLERRGIDVSGVMVYGILAAGSRCDVYTLSLPARTVYKMEKVSVFYTPRSRYDMMSLLTAINAMNMLRHGIQTTLEACSRKPLDAPQNWTCPSLGTPQKIPPAAVPAAVERFMKRTRMLDPSSEAES
ncbi:hypothetical protein BGX30_009548 [Mortierella sp. GBA39]|nr:hypothetical protein BGX30_009548 [Mortierella sp. GBA39]